MTNQGTRDVSSVLKLALIQAGVPDFKRLPRLLVISTMRLHLFLVALPRDPRLRSFLVARPRDMSHLPPSVVPDRYPAIDRLPRDTSHLPVATGRHPVFDVHPPIKLTPELTPVLVPNAVLQTTAGILLSMTGAAPVGASVTMEERLHFLQEEQK